jgi:diguanylate cyclase (GGDEF)-like protein
MSRMEDAKPSLTEAQRLDALERQQITDTPDEENFDRVVRLACAALEAPVGLISFVDGERQWFKARQGLDLKETPREHAFADNPLVTCDNGIRFYAGAPLKTREGFNLGTLCVIDHIPRKISPRDLALLKDMAGIVVNEMELRKKLGTDTLTGLYTRLFLNVLGNREMARARRGGTAFTAAFIDVDFFKRINDGYGHPAGDAVLRGLGPAIRRALRETDLLGRYGGEELVLLLPGTDLAQAAIVLERLRQEVAAMEVPELKGKSVTVSVGAAQMHDDDFDIADILARADSALYRAKESGRNRVELAAAA